MCKPCHALHWHEVKYELDLGLAAANEAVARISESSDAVTSVAFEDCCFGDSGANEVSTSAPTAASAQVPPMPAAAEISLRQLFQEVAAENPCRVGAS